MPTRVIGFYSKGCIAGAVQMPVNGETWQVMRLSRNRNWGHPDLIALLKRLSVKAHKDAGWPGILVGDIGQPRGGPVLTGHASHQIGLDADIWLTPMPDHRLSREEREEMSAVMMVRDDRLDIDPKVCHSAAMSWCCATPRRSRASSASSSIAADQESAVPRGQGRPQLALQDQAVVGHDYHFHIRMDARPAAATARANRRRRAVKAAAPTISPTGSRIRSPSEAADRTAEAEPADDAGRLPADCREVLAAPDAKP